MQTIWRWAGSVAGFVLMVALSVALLEFTSRALHWGVRPIIPAVQDSLGHYRMPSDFESRILAPGRGPYTLCTNGWGLRTNCATPVIAGTPSALLVGDSQMLGWALPWEDSIAGRLENKRRFRVSALAAPLNDIETIQPWLHEYLGAAESKPRLVIVSLNLGNDLEEMYLQRASVTVPVLRAIKNWLSSHSYAYLDVLVAKSKMASTNATWPPGSNPAMMVLDAGERTELARACVETIVSIRSRTSAVPEFIVLLLPNDYQVDPSEFSKYEAFYDSKAEFASWSRVVDKEKSRLDEVQQLVANELRGRSIRVVVASEVLRTRPASQVFDRGSHHLTALGSQLVSDQISRMLDAGHSEGAQP